MEPVLLSALNDFLYCPRRAALKFVEGWRGENVHTLVGDLAHAKVDLPGYEQRAGWRLLRALPLWSDRLGLTGKADLVEVQEEQGRIIAARPVEYKKGQRRRFENDDVQLCAQALCLEEMFGVTVIEGAVFHAESHQRREVAMDATLREATQGAIEGFRAVLDGSSVPKAECRPQCEGCSLHEICLPSAAPSRVQRLAKELFQT